MTVGCRILVAALALLASGTAATGQDEGDQAIVAAIRRAAAARQAGRADHMRREVQTAVGIAGESVPRRQTLAAALIDSGFPELAAQVCEQTIPRAPDAAALRGIHGIALFRMGRYPDAVLELRLATEKDPRRKEWWVELGRAHLHANQEAAALTAIQHALDLAPADLPALVLRAECEYRNMRIAECERTCRAVLDLAPANLTAWQLLVRVLRTTGRLDEAVAAGDAAVKAVGRNPDVLLERGLALLSAARHEEAVADLEAVAKALPGDSRPWLHLCKAYTRLGREKEAAAAKARYLELSPDARKPASRGTESRPVR